MQNVGTSLKIYEINSPNFFKFLLVLKINTAEPPKVPKNKLTNKVIVCPDPSLLKK